MREGQGLMRMEELAFAWRLPHRYTEWSAWHEHIPFAMYAVAAFRPRVLVELGTQGGDSYCAFCQIVLELQLDTRCYAVDTWEGDPHTGLYGPEVLEELRRYHDPLYGGFSRLVKATFDEAVAAFQDGEVDLLHIDGYHTYEAVSHDFAMWFPKLSDRGIVLLHDISVRDGDFGVWRFWEELRGRFPHFEFTHGHGLGVALIGKRPPEAARRLVSLPADDVVLVRDLFASLGQRVALLARSDALRRRITELQRQQAELERRNADLITRLATAQRDLTIMRESEAWRIGLTLSRVGSWVFPPNSTRRKILGLGVRTFRHGRQEVIHRSLSWLMLRLVRWLQAVALERVRGWRTYQLRLAPGPEVEAAGTGGTWRSSGIDPWFILQGTVRGGWVELVFKLETARPTRACLYIDPGTGFSEDARILLPTARNGEVRALLRLPDRVKSLRIDPTEWPGEFRLSNVTLRPLAKWQVALRIVGIALHSKGRRGQLLAKALHILRSGGVQALKQRLAAAIPRLNGNFGGREYEAWVEAYDTLTDSDREAIRRHIQQLAYQPLISVIMPVYNPEERWLRAAIESVRRQLYPRWELCIADDASTALHVRRTLLEYREADPRIKVVFREQNGHISTASNTALHMATGEFVALLDHDDELAEHALYMVVVELNSHPEAALIYSDEDKIDERGRRFDPYFKSELSYDLLLGHNMIGHLTVYRREVLAAVGGFRVGYEGAQDYDLQLRVIERVGTKRIRHIPHVLYHWRAVRGSTALRPEEKAYAHDAARRAIQDHFDRSGIPARSVPAPIPHYCRAVFALPPTPPRVSIIIPTRNAVDLLRRAVASVQDASYANVEIVVVDNCSDEPKTLSYIAELAASGVTVVRYDEPFNFSAIVNLGARRASGEVLLLLNNDIEARDPDWLGELVRHAIRPDVGAVGAALYYPDDTLQHGGVILGVGGVAGHAHLRLPRGHPGYFGWAILTRDVSAVTGACLATRRSIFQEVGGFDSANLPVAFNDVDYCLRVRERGYRVVWTPYAWLYHRESATRGYEDTPEKQQRFKRECDYMCKRWGYLLMADPYYSPNLTLERSDFSLAWPPRTVKPWVRLSCPAESGTHRA